jgi:hypothetical protein
MLRLIGGAAQQVNARRLPAFNRFDTDQDIIWIVGGYPLAGESDKDQKA